MTFQDSDVSNNTSSHLSPWFTSDLVCSRAFTYVAIDMLPRISSVLHSPLSGFVFLIKFLDWMPPLEEWNIYQPAGVRSWHPIIEPIGQIGDLTTVSYLRYWFFFFFCEISILYKILIWLSDVAPFMNLKDRSTGSFWFRLSFQIDLRGIWIDSFLF